MPSNNKKLKNTLIMVIVGSLFTWFIGWSIWVTNGVFSTKARANSNAEAIGRSAQAVCDIKLNIKELNQELKIFRAKMSDNQAKIIKLIHSSSEERWNP